MPEQKTYRVNCPQCGKQEHTITNISRSKGVKLKCTQCDKENKRWHRFDLLEAKE